MNYEVLRKGEGYMAFGFKTEEVEVITSVNVWKGDTVTVFYPALDRRRKLKNWFKRPTQAEAQEAWFENCIATRKELK